MFIFVIATLTASTPVAANTSAEQIGNAANAFLDAFTNEQSANGYNVTYETGDLDARLSLATCDSQPTAIFSSDPWKTTQPSLLIACEGNRPWRMFLPVTLEIHGQGLVAARPLARGERLTASALTTQDVELNATRRSPIRSKDQLIGMEMRRGVNAGTLFTSDLLTAPDAISRGDHVVITAETGGFSVRSRGKALSDGSIGEQVMVENLSSTRTVRARITGPGQVSIPM